MLDGRAYTYYACDAQCPALLTECGYINCITTLVGWLTLSSSELGLVMLIFSI